MFQSAVLAPSIKREKKVRSILEGLCDSSNRYESRIKFFSWTYGAFELKLTWEDCYALNQLTP